MSQLHQAIKNGEGVEVLRTLVLSHPQSLMANEESGRLPLHTATASNSNLEVVRMLLNRHPKGVAEEDEDGRRPLHLAARYNSNVEAVRLLLNRHPGSATREDGEYRLPLHLAGAFNSNVEVVRLLLDRHPNGVMLADKEGRLSLHLAAGYNSNVDVIRLLLNRHLNGVAVEDKEGRLPLHLAAGYNSNVEVVRLLLDRHLNGVAEADKDGRLPLHLAAALNSNVELIRLLLDRHLTGIAEEDKDGRLPLHLAAALNSNVEVVWLLSEQHPGGVMLADKEGRLPLHLAAGYNSNVEVVRLLFEQHPGAAMLADKERRLPLHLAARYNSNVEVVQVLIGLHSESATIADEDGRLPLHLATRYNSNVDVIRLLLAHNPEHLAMEDYDGWLPLLLAVGYNNNVEVVRLLLEQCPEGLTIGDDEGWQPLHFAARYNSNVEVVRLLSEHYPEHFAMKDDDGRLPLHLAARYSSNVEVVRMLLEQHPNGAAEVDEDMRLPLHLAAESQSDVEVVRLLLDWHPKGATMTDKTDRPPLHLAAAFNNNVEVVRLLIDRYPKSVMVADKGGRLPLHIAAEYNRNVDVVRLWLDRYPKSVMVADKTGRLPLHLAAGYNSNVDVIRLLLDRHPNGVAVEDKDGRLPLHIAAGYNSNVDVIRLLLDRRPNDVAAKDKERRLPLHIAARYNSNVEVVRLLLDWHPEGATIADKDGQCALHLAAGYNSNVDVVRLLLNRHPSGAIVADKTGRLPLHLAAGYNSNVEVVRLLLEQHPGSAMLADKESLLSWWSDARYPEAVMVPDMERRLPLHLAARYNSNAKVVRLLLDLRPEVVTFTDKDGRRPLHLAAGYNSNVRVVRLLLDRHPKSLAVEDMDGLLPLHLAAAFNSNVEVGRLLLDRYPGAATVADKERPLSWWLDDRYPKAMMVADKDGRLPLHWAARYNENVNVLLVLMSDCTLYFERSVSFLSRGVIARMCLGVTDKRRFHEIVGGVVEHSLANPHYAASLREIFGHDDNLGLFNLHKGFTGVLPHRRPTATVHICGEKLAGKTTLTSWLQNKLQQRTTWLGRVSTVFSRPKMATMIGFDERTPGLVIHRVDNPLEVQYVLHDYGGHEEFRKVYRQFLDVPQSIYVIVLPLAEKLSDTEHRSYSVEALVSQYKQWLGQIHNALQSASRPRHYATTVITVLNTFSGVLPKAVMPNLEEIRKQLKRCQEAPALEATFEFYPWITVDCRNEHDSISVCMAIETWVTHLSTLPEERATTTLVLFPVVEHLRDSFDRRPIVSKIVEETEYQEEVRRRLLDGGYRKEDEYHGSLDLLVRWWIADSLRARRIMRMSPGSGKETIIVTSVDALSHWLFGKVLDDMRRRSAVVICRNAVRDIVQETIKGKIDAADLLVDVGLFIRIVAYDTDSGQVDIQSPTTSASDEDKFLVIGLIDKRVGAQNMRPPEFRAETTRRIHRWYTLDKEKAVDWGPDFFVTLFQRVMSLVPSCVGPRIYKDAIYAMTEDGQRRTTYIIRPHRHESLGDGFDVIIDVSTEDVTALTFQDIARQNDIVWMGLQAINATCRRLVGESGLREYCAYPDPRSTMSHRWVVDVERELKQAEAQGQTARFQLQKYLYGYFPLERVTLQNLMSNLPQRLEAGEVTNDQLASSILLLHRSIERSVEYTQSMYSQFSKAMVQMAQTVAELHESIEAPSTAAAVTSELVIVDNDRLLTMEATLNNLFRAQLNICRNMCDFPLLVFLKEAQAESLGEMVSSMFTKRYHVCCVCPVCGDVAQSEAYELRVSKGRWSRYLLRALLASMILAGIALKAAGVPTLVADALYTATTTILSDVSRELRTLIDAYRDDVTSTMVSYMESIGEAAAASLAGSPTATTAAVDTIGQEPRDREWRVSWEYIRAMKSLFTESLKDPEATRSGLARSWSDDGDVAFVCADARRGCRERFRQEGRKCLRVVAVYGG